MHPTADTTVVINRKGAARRVMRGVRSPECAGLMRGRFQARARGRSNKRMHATRISVAVNLNHAGGRVMRGVRWLWIPSEGIIGAWR